MKPLLLLQATVVLCLSITATANAQTPVKYDLTITNGSLMPISPAVIYTKNGGGSATPVGTMPTTGFMQLCQTGNVATRLSELKMNSSVKFVTQTNAPIAPGETRAVEVEVLNPQQQSLHIETMYGKSKDACGIGSVNSHSLFALKQHVTAEIIENDDAVLTGAFVDPVLPPGMTYLDPSVCPAAMNAVSCLRELSAPNAGNARVRFFAGYFPSLISALETKYGSTDVQTLLLPTSGAIQFKIKLKH